ncbi:MAG: hypothetical protein AAF196_03360 [Planctomycetota bacterium]
MEPTRSNKVLKTAPGAESEEGIALILALFFSFMAMGIVVSGHTLNRASRTDTDTQFRTSAQATQFARSGLVEGVGWFRRQTSQPVTQFLPVLDEQAEPAVFDTDDPSIGLVRDFRISGNLWGRYEIWRPSIGGEGDDEQRAAFRQQFQAEDTGIQRRTRQAGTAWRIRSVGYVYELNDPELDLRERPNRVVATTALEAELIRRKLAPPGAAAITLSQGRNLTAGSRTRIDGQGGAGVYYPRRTGRPNTRGSTLSGSPRRSQGSSIDISYEFVFGLSYPELKATADSTVTTEANYPNPVPTNGLLIIEDSDARFSPQVPLVGTGIVIVRGNCTIEPGSNSAFNGLLYVDGDLTVRAPALINGAVVCSGRVNLLGSGDFVEVTYDSSILEAIQREFGLYRFLGAFRPVFEQDARDSMR